MLAFLIVAVMFCSVAPAVMFCVNLRAYREPRELRQDEASLPKVAVLIPARNEERKIEWCVRSVLANKDVDIDVLVMDDASTDATANIVEALAGEDARLTLLRGDVLPESWNGKQHSCWRLAQETLAPLMLFLDADVRLEPQCIARMAAFQRDSGAALVSGFPRLICVTPLEKLLLPLIHFVLLSFLPLARMRATTEPSLAAGCGQFLMVNRAAYFKAGGHQAIRATMHDGLKLPRIFRQHGFRTDLADITKLASVRMYRNGREVWYGLGKNATEGMAAPARIVPFTLLLGLGQVMPVMMAVGFLFAGLLIFAIEQHHMFIAQQGSWAWFALWTTLFGFALIASFLPGFLAVKRFNQPIASAVFHPQAVLLLLALQWWALVRQMSGRPVGWRQRTYTSATSGETKQN